MVLLLVSPGVLWAQQEGQLELTIELPPNFEAGNLPGVVDGTQQEQIILGDDFIATESIILGSREESPATEEAGKTVNTSAGAISFGFDATFTQDFQIFTIPFAYRPTANFKLGLAIPLVRRTGNDGEVTGLGDVSASVGYRWGSVLKVLGITTLFVKAPTGEPEAEDQTEFLPTGSGSWDFALYQTFIKRFGRWRGELTAGYRLNNEGDFEANGADITLENGDVANLIVGVDRDLPALPGLVGNLKIDTRHIQETNLTINGTDQHAPGQLTVVDLLPGVKYFMGSGTALRAGLRIPLNHMSDRGLALDFGIRQSF